ncbi:MAG TPA: hypothetical protein VK141_03880, partial [Nitrosomonas sp.]|nr:hypothetical protein [Nitrosomonas sp.]
MTAEELKQEIIAEAKAAGLEIVEESIEKLLVVLEKVVAKFIANSESKVDDIALPFLPMVFGLMK